MNPKIYIILVNYNSYNYTIECIKSLGKSDYQNFQVIVVDNSDSYEYVEIIKNELTTLGVSFYYCIENEEPANEVSAGQSKCIFIKQKENKGFASANNIGINYALRRNDFDSILLLNNDTEVTKNCISNVIEAKRELGSEHIYGCKIYYYDNPDVIWYDGGIFSSWTGKCRHRNLNKKDFFKSDEKTQKTGFITFCFVLIPKKVLNIVGLLDESYFMYFEDLDYCYRCKNAGIGLLYVPKSVIYHKVGASSGGGISEFAASYGYRNEILFTKKRRDNKKYFSLLFIYITRPLISVRWLFRGKKQLARIAIKNIVERIPENDH